MEPSIRSVESNGCDGGDWAAEEVVAEMEETRVVGLLFAGKLANVGSHHFMHELVVQNDQINS